VTWYFAYGSNMQSATLRGRRCIEYRRALPGRAPGWRLVLDKPPLVGSGVSFANIIADPAAEVWGVLFEIADHDLAHIDLTEGVLIGNYARVEVAVAPLADGSAASGSSMGPPPQRAFTLTSDQRDPSLHPSQRYMQLLIDGALEHGLPADYVKFLRRVPTVDEPEHMQQWRPLIDELLRKP